jgi:hypothetical protein
LTGLSTATCPAGKVLLGGGAIMTTAGTGVGAVHTSRPQNGTSTTAWEARGVVVAEIGNNHVSVTAYAVCTV